MITQYRFINKLTAIILISVFILPSVSAIEIFGNEDVYTIYYDEALFEQVKPGIFGIKPEIVYWRIMQKQGDAGVIYVEMFFYWAEQEHYISEHEHDWEFLLLVVNELNLTYRVAYDEWHYIIGREMSPRLYNNTHVFVEILEEYHPVKMFDTTVFGDKIDEGLDYTDIDVQRLDGTALKDAAEEVGFNEKLFEEPGVFFEKGWFGWKKYSAWRSWWRAAAVYVDRKLDWVDFGD